MQFVPALVELSIEVTLDSPGLDVGLSVYDVTTGTPSLVGSVVAMANITGTHSYFAQFTPVSGKQYVVHKAVYTDGTLTTIDVGYGQASESLVCKDFEARLDHLDVDVSSVGGGTPPTAAAIADAVWDEVLSGHLTPGTTGNALNAAGAAGDPWTTILPGSYGEGTAGKLIGDNIDAPISTRVETGEMTVDDISAGVWNRMLRKHDVSGTFGTMMKRIFKFILIGFK